MSSQQYQSLAQKPPSPAELHQELQLQIGRIQREVEGHNATRTLLVHTQNNARYWDRQAMVCQSQMHNLETRLLAAENKCQELARENSRLNLVLSHLSPIGVFKPTDSKYNGNSRQELPNTVENSQEPYQEDIQGELREAIPDGNLSPTTPDYRPERQTQALRH